MKAQFIVTINIPAKSSKSDVRQYIKDAVNSWRGQLEPPYANGEDTYGDPLWYLEDATVKHAGGTK